MDEVEKALSRAYAHVDPACEADPKTDPERYYTELGYLSFATEWARKTIGLALELSGATTWQRRLDDDLADASKHLLGTDEDGEPSSPALIRVQGWVNVLKAVHGVKSGRTAQRQHLRELLKQTTEIVHLFNVDPTKEKDVSDPVYKIVRLSFPDAVFEPHLARPLRYFKPEFGIPSLETLVEYKYTANEAETKRVLAGLFEDMKGYSGANGWTQFIAVVYVADPAAGLPRLEAEWERGLENDSWELILVQGPGSRPRRAAKP